MYTQCPQCRTVFRVTEAQLRKRQGLVRCGQCNTTFRGDEHLMHELPAGAAAHERRPAAKTRRGTKTGGGGASRARTAPRAHRNIPPLAELPLAPPRRTALPAPLWIVANIVLAAALGAQAAFFYRHELATWPGLRPLVLEACTILGCELRTPSEVGRIELLEQTGIAAHPKYENALRIRIAMVSRAPQPQPFPLLEVTLTDRAGHALARRAFAAHEYLAGPAGAVLEPNVAVNTVLDVTNPDGKAVGYEIRPVAPP